MDRSWIFYWFICISAVGVIMPVYDKWAAVYNGNPKNRHKKRRVPQRTLLWIGGLGGAAAELCTMLCIRHKTRRMRFMVGLPIFAAAHLALLLLLLQLG